MSIAIALYRKLERPEGAWLGLTGLVLGRYEAAGHQTRHWSLGERFPRWRGARPAALPGGGKSQHDPRAKACLLFHRSVELGGQDTDDAQAKRFVLAEQCALAQADAIVLDG